MPSPVVRGLVVLVGLATVSAHVGMFVLRTTRDRLRCSELVPVRGTPATGLFTLPLVDGRPLPDRMASVGVEPCLVPTALPIAP